MRAINVIFFSCLCSGVECCEFESETKTFCFHLSKVKVKNLNEAKNQCATIDSIPLEIYSKDMEMEIVQRIILTNHEDLLGERFILNAGLKNGEITWLSSETFATYTNLWDSPLANITDRNTFLMVLEETPYWERNTHATNTLFHLICIKNLIYSKEVFTTEKRNSTFNFHMFINDLKQMNNESHASFEDGYTNVYLFGFVVILFQMIFMCFAYLGVKHAWNVNITTPEVIPEHNEDGYTSLMRSRFSSSVTPDSSLLQIDNNLMTAT